MIKISNKSINIYKMHNFFKFLWLIIFFITYSCGDVEREQKPVVVPKPTGYDQNPQTKQIPQARSLVRVHEYFLSDANCQQTTEQNTIKDGVIYSKLSRSTVQRFFSNFSSFRNNHNSFISDIISKTTYDDQFVGLCDQIKNDCTKYSVSWTRRPGLTEKPLKICESNDKAYPRDSYENVTLTAAYFLQQAYEAFLSTRPNIEVQKVHLMIMPKFSHIVSNPMGSGTEAVEQTLTQNLAYFSQPYPTIGIYPDVYQKSLALAEQNGRLWESAFALAHEFGHHIETVIASPLKKVSAFVESGLISHALPQGRVKNNATLNAEQSNLHRNLFLGAVSEAFADLLAYYSTGESVESLLGIPCFADKRNIEESFFRLYDSSGSKFFAQTKTLSTQVLDRLFYPHLAPASNGPCDPYQIDYTNIHMVGASIAGIIHQLNNTYVNTLINEGVLANNRKTTYQYELLLQWYLNQLSEVDKITNTQNTQLFVDAFSNSIQMTINTDSKSHSENGAASGLANYKVLACSIIQKSLSNQINCQF